MVPEAEVVAVEGGKHLWVGESQVRRVLDEIVRVVNPARSPLPTEVAQCSSGGARSQPPRP